jgi:beta-lactam-binding protein with PASTA domain
MIAEVSFLLALLAVIAGGGLMFWSMKDKPKRESPKVEPQPIREDIQKLEREVFAKADQVMKIADDTQEIVFPEGAGEEIVAEEPQNPNDTAIMRAVSEKVSKIRRRAGI